MRCLTLAEALRDRGVTSHFVCRAHPGNLIAKVRSRGFEVSALAREPDDVRNPVAKPAHAPWLGADWRVDAAATREILQSFDPDWLVVDHYALDRSWEREVRTDCGHLMVIDDLADRGHACDLLLDQNIGREARDYVGLVDGTTRLMVGVKYALLRQEFAALRDCSIKRRRRGTLRHILISMGGIDRHNVTGKVLDSLAKGSLKEGQHITVVMGQNAPGLEQVKVSAARLPRSCEVRVEVNNMAKLMADADLAYGALGVSALERMVVGLPSIITPCAENQLQAFAQICGLGAALPLDETHITTQLQSLTPSILHAMTIAAAGVLDGNGTILVAKELIS